MEVKASQFDNALTKNRALSDLADAAHLSLQYAVYALITIHAAAALHHHFWRRNGVLARMLPSRRDRHRSGA